MIYSMEHKIDEKKESRSLTIDNILGLEAAIKEAEALDNFNNSFLFNPDLEAKPDLPAIQDLILLYYEEAAFEDDSQTKDPILSEYTKKDWEAILNNALSYSGDGIFYPFMPGANVSASLEESGIDPSDMGSIANTVSKQGTAITQNTAEIALRATKTELNDFKEEINTIENNYGYKYVEHITIYGDSDKLYPVIIKGGDQNVKREILVNRSYDEQAPPDWSTTAYKGALTVKIKCNFGGWGGVSYSWEIHELEENHSRTFAGCQNVMGGMAFAIFLRGGGTTGAIYHLYSNQSLNTTLYGGASPQICYNNELLGETGQYSWNAPDPKTFKTLKPDKLQDADQKAIDIRNFIPLSKKSVKTSDVEYYLSTSSTALSGGSWLTKAPQWVDGKFMWSRTKTTLNDGTVSYSPSSGGTCIAGAKGATGPQGEDAYQLQVISEQGLTFRMGEDFSTTLEVKVWQGGEEITHLFSDEDFRWRRTSNDTYQDSVWNSAHYSTGGKIITLTQDDVVGRSNFFCDLLTKRS